MTINLTTATANLCCICRKRQRSLTETSYLVAAVAVSKAKREIKKSTLNEKENNCSYWLKRTEILNKQPTRPHRKRGGAAKHLPPTHLPNTPSPPPKKRKSVVS
jgi:hypothetical protein